MALRKGEKAGGMGGEAGGWGGRTQGNQEMGRRLRKEKPVPISWVTVWSPRKESAWKGLWDGQPALTTQCDPDPVLQILSTSPRYSVTLAVLGRMVEMT